MSEHKTKESRTLFTLKVFWRAFKAYRYRIVGLITMGFLGGLFEGIGINIIIPLFSFVVKTEEKATDTISQITEKVFNYLHISYELKYLLVLIAILFASKAIMTFLINYITDKIKTDYVKKTRDRLFKLTIESNWTYLSKQKIGYLEKVLMTDINTYSALLSYASSTVILLTNTLIYTAIAFTISPEITAITIACGGLFFLLFKPLVYRVRIISHQTANVLKRVANHINENMLGMKTIKAMGLEKVVIDSGQAYFEELRSVEMKLSILSSLTYVITQPVSVLLIIGLFAFSYKLTAFNFASFAVIVYSINKIFTYIQDGQSRIQNINALYPFLKTAFEYETNAIENRERSGTHSEFTFEKKLTFAHVSFNYSKNKTTLTDINFTIPRGHIIGIIGPSGAGKTTMVDLLLGLIRPSSGQILVDDTDIATIQKDAWRNRIGYVSQDVFLINDTIENNIKLHNPHISDADMITAAKMANIYDFISLQPDRFQTPVGERGMDLSGGQRQRIALARVLARKPEIIILDEATSALDNESETLIQKAIEALRGTITVIIIAHRPSTVTNADALIVIANGTVAETGSPEKLMSSPHSYFHKINTEHSLV
ncbi:MAG: ABC transporter ATP-binding protein [Patescibacteria group bacterium]